MHVIPPPTNFIIKNMNETQLTLSWEGNEWNKYIIGYGLQSLSNPEDGEKINITNETSCAFTNLDFNSRYDIYI